MKKIISIFLSSLMLCTVFCTTAFAAEDPAYSSDEGGIVLELDYMDFYENEEYYMNLVIEKDYILHFNVPDECRELERERRERNKRVEQVNGEFIGLTPAISRYDYIPTIGIHTTPGTGQSFHVKGNSSLVTLYTNNYYTGSTHYIFDFENTNYTNVKLHIKAYNVIDSQSSKYFSSGSYVIKYTMKGNSTTAKQQRFYLQFDPPVHAEGDIIPSSLNN